MNPEKIVVVIQARKNSTRLPGKVFKELAGKPVLAHVIERSLEIDHVDSVCVAVPTGEKDAFLPITDLYENCFIFEGSEDNVYQRTLDAGLSQNAGAIMRITSDCPYLDIGFANALTHAYLACPHIVYARYTFNHGIPVGFDCEIVHTEALQSIKDENLDDYDKEHATPYIYRYPDRFPALYLSYAPNVRDIRLTIDTQDDFDIATEIFDTLYNDNPFFGLFEIQEFLKSNPELCTKMDLKEYTKTLFGEPEFT